MKQRRPYKAMRYLLFAVCVSLWGQACGGPIEEPTPFLPGETRGASTTPNIIVIMVDDLGWGDLGSYGQTLIATPELDEMAAEGVRFTQFYSAAPHCNPARASLLTGLHTGHTQLRLNSSLNPLQSTLAEVVSQQDYQTAMYGKWGVSEVDESDVPIGGVPELLGFDQYLSQLTHRDAHVYFLDSPPAPPGTTDQPYYPDVRQFLYQFDGVSQQQVVLSEDRYVHDEFVDRSLQFIDDYKEDNFFLYLPLAIPHAELAIPDDESIAAYQDSEGDSIFFEIPYQPALDGRLYDRWNEQPRATYAAMVSRLSRDVGRILDALQTHGIADRTLVLFTSDNGPHDAGGIRSPDFFNSAGGLSGMKWSLREGGIRVPMIAWWPGTIQPGVIETPAALWDLLPTIASMIGGTVEDARDGVSLSSLLLSAPGTLPERHLYWETFNGRADYRQAARKNQYKALRRVDDDYVELYNLDDDPAEAEDLSDLVPMCEVLTELKTILNAEHTAPLDNPDGVFDIEPLPLTCEAEVLFRDNFS